MASGAAGALPRGFCDLPDVPALSSLGTDAIRALLGGADGAGVAESILAPHREVALEEGDAGEQDETSLRALLADDDIVGEILNYLQPDIKSLCKARGWPMAPFVACKCDRACMVELARQPAGGAALTSALAPTAAEVTVSGSGGRSVAQLMQSADALHRWLHALCVARAARAARAPLFGDESPVTGRDVSGARAPPVDARLDPRARP